MASTNKTVKARRKKCHNLRKDELDEFKDGPSNPQQGAETNLKESNVFSATQSSLTKKSTTCKAERPCTKSPPSTPRKTPLLDSSSSCTTPKTVKPNELIAYVHNLSPLKRNKKNTMHYCTLTLQTSSEVHEALLYSKNKRSILMDSEDSHTPLKIQRYTTTPDTKKLIINEMTQLTSPDPTEYCFQFKKVSDPSHPLTTIGDILKSGQEFDNVTVCAKVVSLGEQRIVGHKQLRLVTATFADLTASIHVDIWEQHIDKIHLGTVYRITPLQVPTSILCIFSLFLRFFINQEE